MNITAAHLTSSLVVPVLMAVLLIWGTRRGRSTLIFAVAFLAGGFVSFVLALGTSRLLLPLESLVAGVPGSIRAHLASAFLTAALPEELARFVTVNGLIAAARNSARREIVVTCGVVGLGFAMFENMLYSLTSPSAVASMLARVVPTLSHGCSALIMGALLDRAASNGRRLATGLLLLALAVPGLLHGLYDFGAFVLEASEFPDLPDDPGLADLKPLGPILATMLLTTAVGLVELIWSGRIVYDLRHASRP